MTNLHLIDDSASELIVGGLDILAIQGYKVKQTNFSVNTVASFTTGATAASLTAATIKSSQSNIVAFV